MWLQAVFGVVCLVTCGSGQLDLINQWNLMTFNVPYNYPRNDKYTPENTMVTGVEVGWDRIFFALPRFRPGNPASFGFIPRHRPGLAFNKSPPIEAYPSWEWHSAAVTGDVNSPQHNCTGLVSVFRSRIDRCNRLWILDSGILDSLVSFDVVCPPKILIFDLRTDRLVRSITLPQEVLRRHSLLSNMVIDHLGDETTHDSCDHAFVYLSDTVAPGIVVYDARRDAAWRLSHPNMFPEPEFGKFTLQGESFTLMDGIIGMAISPPGSYQKLLYFQAFASDKIYSIPTAALQAGPNTGDDSDLPVTLVGHKSSQAAPLAFDPLEGSLVFSPVAETALAAWVPGSSDHRVVAYDAEALQFVLDIRAADRDGGALWMISTRLQKFMRQSLNSREVNIRLMRVVPQHPNPYRSIPYSGYSPAFANNTLLHFGKK
nr:PREDICTED: protein yellow-like [Bemisia tabaci]